MSMQVLDSINQTISLHQEAIAHLEAYRGTLHQMQGIKNDIPKPSKSESKKATANKSQRSSNRVAASNDNDISLREAVWNVISREENKDGMRVAQIISTIKEENIWTTEGDLANMVHGAVYKLKKENKLVRGDDKTYKIAKGAALED